MLLLIGTLATLAGCGTELSSSDGNGATNPFAFIVLSDIHVRLPGQPDDEIYDNQGNLDNLRGAIERINSDYWNADFVAVTGDLVGNLYSEDPEDYLNGSPNPAETFHQMMESLIPPSHVALGNHDYLKGFDSVTLEGIGTTDIAAIEAVWRKVLGIEPYYGFTHKGINMIFLNSNRGPLRDEICRGSTMETFCTGSFDAEQLAWFEEKLQEGLPAILFVHHPPHTDDAGTGWTFYHSFRIDPDDPFYPLTEQYKHTIVAIFVGHGHRWKEDTLHGTIQVFETGSLGDQLGRPDHIRVVEIDPTTLEMNLTRLDR